MFAHHEQGSDRGRTAGRGDATEPGLVDPGLVDPGLSDQQLEEELCSQAAHLAVAECHLVILIAEFDRREAWADQGLRSCAHWLNWRCGVALGAAREQVRVGRALRELPIVRQAFASGQLSYSKVRAITRVATPEMEEALVEIARSTSASQLETLVREYRRADPGEGRAALARHALRFVRSHTDADGMVVIHARLSPEDGACVLAAIETVREAMRGSRLHGEGGPGGTAAAADGSDASPVPWGVSAETRGGLSPSSGPCEGPGDEAGPDRADALVAVCESVLDGNFRDTRDGPGTLVLVHVDETVLENPDRPGCCAVDRAGAFAAHSARRLACDAAVSRLVYRGDGEVVPKGRTRSVPLRMRRAVLARDRGCRFPGCAQRAFVDLHHVVYWTDGGPTTPGNLLCLCRHHHRLVHEGGYRVVVDEVVPGRLRVWTPEGNEVPVTPPRLVASGPGVVARHHESGLGIDATTLTYCGEAFDLGLTIDGLLCLAGRIDGGPGPAEPSASQVPASTTAGRTLSVSVAS